MARKGDWMQTFSGVQFWPLDPRPEEIFLPDIAHALAHQCRFAGHTTEFYSVAQHSVLVSEIVPDADQTWALLHDAAEAYLVDLPRPIKKYSLIGAEYQEVEGRLMGVICRRFGLPMECPASVKLADDRILMTEKRDLMPNSPAKWREQAEPVVAPIMPWLPRDAEKAFSRALRDAGVWYK